MSTTQQKSLFVQEPDPAPWERDDQADRLFAEVVFNRPVDEAFLYEVPYPLRGAVEIGKRVEVPFGRGNERLYGYCVRLTDRATRGAVKKVAAVIDEQSLVTPGMLELARWVAERYCCALGQALDAVLPASVRSGALSREVVVVRLSETARGTWTSLKLTAVQRRLLEVLSGAADAVPMRELARTASCSFGPIRTLEKRGLVELSRSRVASDLAVTGVDEAERVPPALNADQSAVMERIESKLAQGGFHPMLLFGVTGSGKTEVYLRAIDRVVRSGRQAIVLVPEISLTPQTIRRFRGRFARVAVLHSHLSDADRHAQWREIAAGQADVVVGARSAVFAPARRLGLIVLDEEHEGTFKQDTTPRYHARDVAWRRAELEGVPLLLGSATPSLEAWHAVQADRCELLRLPERVLNRPLPEVKLIDLRMETSGARRRGAISLPLEHAMRRALEADGQVILLLNRRGFATHIQCRKCGHVEKCRRCDFALVYHRDRSVAMCHCCDLSVPAPQSCPECRDPGIHYHGLGTQRLEQEVRAKFPGFACQRMDTDSMRARGAHERVLSAFRRGQVRILLGTQMIAKGLDFPGVTLVGVVNADTSLHLPDFRASERTFQLVAQVAGRTGRGDQAGRVLVQTFSPAHAAIRAAAHHDFLTFAGAELPVRQEHRYPPYYRLTRIIVRGRVEAQARTYIESIAARLEQLLGGAALSSVRLLGPAPAPVTRVKNLFRFHLQLQAPLDVALNPLIRQTLAEFPPGRHVEVAVDVDPLSML